MVETIMTYNRDDHCAIVIPYYNTPNALYRLLDKIPQHMLQQTLVIDDGSTHPPSDLPCPMIRHGQNKGYGAAQQTAYLFFLHDEKWKHIQQIAMVHGDDQYDFHSIWNAALESHSIQLGSRHILGEHNQHYPWWRKLGNQLLTTTANLTFQTQYTDLHTGARIYSIDFLRTLPWGSLSDDFVFDHQVLSIAMNHGTPIVEFPIPADYSDGVSSISFRRSVRYGFGCLHSLWAAKRERF